MPLNYSNFREIRYLEINSSLNCVTEMLPAASTLLIQCEKYVSGKEVVH
jgi:hypothetical protein